MEDGHRIENRFRYISGPYCSLNAKFGGRAEPDSHAGTVCASEVKPYGAIEIRLLLPARRV